MLSVCVWHDTVMYSPVSFRQLSSLSDYLGTWCQGNAWQVATEVSHLRVGYRKDAATSGAHPHWLIIVAPVQQVCEASLLHGTGLQCEWLHSNKTAQHSKHTRPSGGSELSTDIPCPRWLHLGYLCAYTGSMCRGCKQKYLATMGQS